MKPSILAGLFILAGSAVLYAAPQSSTGKIVPKLEPVAETKLLMEGLANPNYRGLERLLKQKPADDQTWTFARGQALLIAETANLLMIRPPKNQGQPIWFDAAMQLRASANQIAFNLGNKDYEKSKAALQALPAQCNRCHQLFRVPIEVTPTPEVPPP
jgi:hypothetical protein